MPHKRKGCLPFFVTMGMHPLLPFDIVKANYLLPPPNSILSTTDLVARRAIALQKCQGNIAQLHVKVHEVHNRTAIRFKREHSVTICDFKFKMGNLILICNTVIEKSLNCKMHMHYLGPMVVVSRNQGGAYVICELDSTLLHSLIAAYQAVPYFTHNYIDIPDLEQHIDISVAQLHTLEAGDTIDPDEPD